MGTLGRTGLFRRAELDSLRCYLRPRCRSPVHKPRFLAPNPGPSVSTVPANGDVNPYGVTQVPVTTGNLVQGDILVSNFNNSANLQGTGTTIMEISPAGAVQTLPRLTLAICPVPAPAAWA